MDIETLFDVFVELIHLELLCILFAFNAFNARFISVSVCLLLLLMVYVLFIMLQNTCRGMCMCKLYVLVFCVNNLLVV